jgi:hypothetical protein
MAELSAAGALNDTDLILVYVPGATIGSRNQTATVTVFRNALLSSTSPLINGTVSAGASTRAARDDHVHPTDTTRAPTASPTFTGTVTVPTPSTADSSTKAASTAYVQANLLSYLTSATATATYLTQASATATYAPKQFTVNNQTGTTYTPVLTDDRKMVTLTNANAITVTVPLNATVAFPVGTRIEFTQLGAGQATFTAVTGVTLLGEGGKFKIVAQHGVAILTKLATDTWLLHGPGLVVSSTQTPPAVPPASPGPVDYLRMPIPQVGTPSTQNITSAGITVNTTVSDRTYTVTQAIGSGTPAITLGSSGRLVRCKVNCANLVDVGVRGPGTVVDCDVYDANYANYYEVGRYEGCCVGRRGYIDHYLTGTTTMPADAMIKSYDTENWGVFAESFQNQNLPGTIVGYRSGATSMAGSETAMGLDGASCSGNKFGTLYSYNLPGYFLAFRSGASNNEFAYVAGVGEHGDPAVVMADASNGNRITLLECKSVTRGIVFGEINDFGESVSCDDNWIGTLKGDDFSYSCAIFMHGDSNRIDTINVSNVQDTDYDAAIEFCPDNIVGQAAVTNNSVGTVTITGTVKPTYAVHWGPLATGNTVGTGTSVFVTGLVFNESGGSTNNSSLTSGN